MTLGPSLGDAVSPLEGVLLADGAGRRRRLHADLLRILSPVSTNFDTRADQSGAWSPGDLGDVTRGYPVRQDDGLQGGLYGPLSLWLRRCSQVTRGSLAALVGMFVVLDSPQKPYFILGIVFIKLEYVFSSLFVC